MNVQNPQINLPSPFEYSAHIQNEDLFNDQSMYDSKVSLNDQYFSTNIPTLQDQVGEPNTIPSLQEATKQNTTTTNSLISIGVNTDVYNPEELKEIRFYKATIQSLQEEVDEYQSLITSLEEKLREKEHKEHNLQSPNSQEIIQSINNHFNYYYSFSRVMCYLTIYIHNEPVRKNITFSLKNLTVEDGFTYLVYDLKIAHPIHYSISRDFVIRKCQERNIEVNEQNILMILFSGTSVVIEASLSNSSLSHTPIFKSNSTHVKDPLVNLSESYISHSCWLSSGNNLEKTNPSFEVVGGVRLIYEEINHNSKFSENIEANIVGFSLKYWYPEDGKIFNKNDLGHFFTLLGLH